MLTDTEDDKKSERRLLVIRRLLVAEIFVLVAAMGILMIGFLAALYRAEGAYAVPTLVLVTALLILAVFAVFVSIYVFDDFVSGKRSKNDSKNLYRLVFVCALVFGLPCGTVAAILCLAWKDKIVLPTTAPDAASEPFDEFDDPFDI